MEKMDGFDPSLRGSPLIERAWFDTVVVYTVLLTILIERVWEYAGGVEGC